LVNLSQGNGTKQSGHLRGGRKRNPTGFGRRVGLSCKETIELSDQRKEEVAEKVYARQGRS